MIKWQYSMLAFIIFVIFELLAFVLGSLFTWSAECKPCDDTLAIECPKCPSGNYSLAFLAISTFPNLGLAFAISFFTHRIRSKRHGFLI